MMVLMALPTESRATPRREHLLTDVLDGRIWRIGLYLLLALPLGIAAYLLLLGGVVGGVVGLPILIGAALLLGALWLVGGLAELQRWLAALLGIRFARPVLPPVYDGILPWLRATLADPATYRALLFHMVQLPLAALCWAVLGSLLAAVVAGLGSVTWFWHPEWFQLSWRESTVLLTPAAVGGLALLGLGTVLVMGGVLNLMGRMWVRLCLGLLTRDINAEAARREVVALRQAAGRVALGDDLEATLRDLTAQAQATSTARTVAVVAADGSVQALSGPDVPGLSGSLTGSLAGPLEVLPAPGEASVTPTPEGGLLVALPVTLPASAGLSGGTLRAVYAPGVRPSGDELAFLLSMADHAGTALHAAQLIERAGVRAGEQERARLARELHDSVAQALYGISLGAKTARATLERDLLDGDSTRTRASLDYTIGLAEGGVSEMKALLFSLRPDALEEGGLVAALSQHAHALEARHGLNVHADLGAEPSLTPEAQAAAYRVAQEALHNVVKHARAHEVWLSVAQQSEEVVLTVRDDGRGFDPQAQGHGSLGQRSMRERAAGVGGSLSVQSVSGNGTTVQLRLPATPGAAQAAPQGQEASV